MSRDECALRNTLIRADAQARAARFDDIYEPLQLTPLPVVIELDPNAGWIAFEAAKRDWSKQ